MLTPVLRKNRAIESVDIEDGIVFLKSQRGVIRIMPLSGETFRVSYSEDGKFDENQGDYLLLPSVCKAKVNENEKQIVIEAGEISLAVDRFTSAVSLLKGGKVLFSESSKERNMERYDSFRLKKDGKIETEDVKTADGVKKHVVSAEREYYKTLYRTRLFMQFEKNEKIFGLGQYEEGVWDYRGTTRYIHQANKQISMPLLISSKGYGLMFTTKSPSVFSDTEYGTYLYTTADYYMDYIVTAPDKFEDIISNVRALTGKAAILPRWAYSYVQSKERYETQDEIVEVAKRFVKENIPVGCIVLDWFSWEEGMWGQKTFDASRFYDVPKMVEELHKRNIHFMMSIWPAVDEKSDNFREFNGAGLLLPGTNVYDAFSEEGRKMYWDQVMRGLASKGVESFWCDSSEPITPEWEKDFELTPQDKFSEYMKRCEDSLYVDKGNAYGYYHAKGLFEGYRKAFPDKRLVNLTRSGYFGSAQFGAVLWSGDISASWEVLNKQIIAGLQFAMCSGAYWTLDIGAFFVKQGAQWYWDGKYPDTNSNNGYRELYTRWLQYGAFLSMFRSHGTDVSREPWNFGKKGEMFYDAIVGAIELREKLMPYIYSLGADVSRKNKMFIKPLFFRFKDKECLKINKQFMMGDSIMVCPVTKPMYYGEDGEKLPESDMTVDIYLPKDCGWYDFYSGEYFEGGQTIKAYAPIDRIPLYVPAGSIIPTTFEGKCVANVYPGNSVCYELYSDSGEGYECENGEFSVTRICWNEIAKEATIEVTGKEEYAPQIIVNVR